VPDSFVLAMLGERDACLRCGGDFILDCFPRTLEQAQALGEMLKSERLALTALINYELPISDIVARFGGRLTCEKCKAGLPRHGACAQDRG
jgi:adenylate kinase